MSFRDTDAAAENEKMIKTQNPGTEYDARIYSPSVSRNKEAVQQAFESAMPQAARVLEIASGSGEHGAHIVQANRSISWTYTDIDPPSLDSQSAWVAALAPAKLRGPFELDVSQGCYGLVEDTLPYDVMFASNLIHISPFSVTEGLFVCADRLLASEGKIFLYGPFARNGVIAPSNARFSHELSQRNSLWGVRDLDRDVLPAANASSFELDKVIAMPANNLSVVFRRK